MSMKAEQQYIDLFTQCEAIICRQSADVLNAPRAKAFADFEKLSFPTRKQEKYKYTEVSKYFAPDYGLNLNRLEFPVNPYEVFKCDVPNMSTSLYFVVNDTFDKHVHPSAQLPEGVYFGSLKDMAEQRLIWSENITESWLIRRRMLWRHLIRCLHRTVCACMYRRMWCWNVQSSW